MNGSGGSDNMTDRSSFEMNQDSLGDEVSFDAEDNFASDELRAEARSDAESESVAENEADLEADSNGEEVESEESVEAKSAADESPMTVEEQERFYVERLQRMQAEFENFRRRTQQELRDREERTIVQIFRSVLPVVDALRLASESVGDSEDSQESVTVGLKLILDKVTALLGEFSIEEVPAVGEPFDPEWHEALVHQESDEVAAGSVLQELERGYRFRDTLVRAARGIVAKALEGE